MRRRRDLCSGTTQRIPVPLILPLATVRMTHFFSSTFFDESQLDEECNCPETATSELWILDAGNFTDALVRVQLPQRVPYGLHGNWFSETQRTVQTFRTAPEMKFQNHGIWPWVKGSLVKAVG